MHRGAARNSAHRHARGPPTCGDTDRHYEDAVDAIVCVMTEDLQLPVPRTSFTLYFYPYREAFAQGLTEKFNTDPTLARAIAKSALGRIRQTVEGKQFLVNEEILHGLSGLQRHPCARS